MLKRTNRRSKLHGLAAPIVVTAVFAPGCSSAPIHENPGPPRVEPTASATETANPGDPKPVATGTAPDLATLPDPPEGWTIEKNADGSCTAIPKETSCPPGASCNPAPPFRVKCVAGNDGGKSREKK